MQTLFGSPTSSAREQPLLSLRDQWLAVATRGLSESAVERVRTEIGDHYESALEAARAHGVEDLDAERRAVAALGDAKTANRQYRRVLLTTWQALEVRGMSALPLGPEGPTSRSCFWCGVFIAMIGLAPLAFIVFTRGGVALLTALGCYAAAYIVQEAILRNVVVRSIRGGRMIRLVRWGVLAAGATIAFINPVLVGAVAGTLLAFVHREYRRFVLRRKLPVEQWPQGLYN